MASFVIESVPARLSGNTYNLDEEESHIKVNQELARATGAGALLERICPAKVYSVEADGTVGVEYAACLELRDLPRHGAQGRAHVALSARQLRHHVP